MRRSNRQTGGWGVVIVMVFGLMQASAQISMEPAVNYGNIDRPSGMTHGDFDQDGDLDLVTTAGAVDRVVLFQNGGAGTFGTSTSTLLPASSSPQDVIAGNWDGDLDMDLAVALRDPAGSVQFLFNNGSGSFSLGPSVAVGDLPRGLSIGDYDGDLDMDLAVANRNADTMSILTNDGLGGFSSFTVAVGSEPRDTVFGNFLADDGLEIAVTNHDSRTVSILDQVGGVFTPVMTLSVGAVLRPDGLTAANLDGSGLDDLVVATGDPPNFATVFMNNGAGFAAPLNYATGGSNSSQIVATDLNCDGNLDLAVSNTDSNNMSLLTNLGNGTFGAPQIIATGIEPGELTAGNWDGDRDTDLAVANQASNNISVLINSTCTITADFNGDGNLDCADVNALVVDIAAGLNTMTFDLTGDGLVDGADLNQWLADAGAVNLPSGGAYPLGDATLDGRVDGSDFNEWNANKFTPTAAWCSGDFNADGRVDGTDFGIWNAHKFTSASDTAQVPEPAVPGLLLVGLAWRFARRR